MREPSLRTSRRAIAGVLATAALVGGAGFYLGRSTSPELVRAGQADARPVPAPTPTASAIVESATLDRGNLIDLAAAAADATASGAVLPQRVRGAIGRRVEVALPFGCSGPAPDDSEHPLRWRYDAEEETLRLHVAVTRWAASDWALMAPQTDGTPDDQLIEGFWVARPWSSSGACPPRASEAIATVTRGNAQPATGDASSSLAIAQFIRADGRRESLREGRPFESVQRVSPTDFDAARGFRLVLSGRIARVPTGQAGTESPVRCIQPGGADSRPRCIVAVALEEIRIENPGSGSPLASWPLGRN